MLVALVRGGGQAAGGRGARVRDPAQERRRDQGRAAPAADAGEGRGARRAVRVRQRRGQPDQGALRRTGDADVRGLRAEAVQPGRAAARPRRRARGGVAGRAGQARRRGRGGVARRLRRWELDVTERHERRDGRAAGDRRRPRDAGPHERVGRAAAGAARGVQGANDPWGRPRHEILAEMRRVRATLTGDAAAYEDENEAMVATLKAAVTLRRADRPGRSRCPGVGLGFIGSMALNIGATVATNMMIQGEDYTLDSFRNDVLGGVLGGLGGKLGEEIVGRDRLHRSPRAPRTRACRRPRRPACAPRLGAHGGQRHGHRGRAVAARRRWRRRAANLVGSTAGIDDRDAARTASPPRGCCRTSS